MIGGAFAYSLWKNGVADPTDGDWYLRSQSTGREPGPPQVQPGVPVYEAYPRALLALNGLPTMQERIGNRYWTGAGNPAGLAGCGGRGRHDAALGRPRRGPPRLGAGRGLAGRPRAGRRRSASGPTTTWTSGSCRSAWTAPVHETDDGVVIAGLTFSYGTVDADVSSDYGDGSDRRPTATASAAA